MPGKVYMWKDQKLFEFANYLAASNNEKIGNYYLDTRTRFNTYSFLTKRKNAYMEYVDITKEDLPKLFLVHLMLIGVVV